MPQSAKIFLLFSGVSWVASAAAKEFVGHSEDAMLGAWLLNMPWQAWAILITLWMFGSLVRIVVEMQAGTIRPTVVAAMVDIAVIVLVGGISAFLALCFCEGMSELTMRAFGFKTPELLTLGSVLAASFNKRTVLDRFTSRLTRAIEDSKLSRE